MSRKSPYFLHREGPDKFVREEVAKPAGAGEAQGEARYVATFSNPGPDAFALGDTATDGEGFESVSPVLFRVNAAPPVKLRPLADAPAGSVLSRKCSLRPPAR